MMRESLTPGSAHAFMIVTPSDVKGLAFQRRTSTGGISTHTAGGGGTPPAWVRLTREGSTISAYRSPDGFNWTFVGSDTIAMGATIHVGLAVTSHNNTMLATATFDSVSVTAGSSTPPSNNPPTIAITAPADNATFSAPASITLAANAADDDGTIASVTFFSGATQIGSDTTSPYSLSWSNVPQGTYSITARAVDDDGAAVTSPVVTVRVEAATSPSTLPQGWSHGDIGAVGAPGDAGFAGGVFTVRGSGADIWEASDEFQFAYQTMTGDGTITARVDSVDAVDQWTKAGVMIRAALTPESRHAMMVASAAKGLAFQRRVSDGGVTTHTGGALTPAPVWVRLQRSGSTITASTSADGTTWTVVGSDTIALPATVYVGLPVTSHNDGIPATAAFSSVAVTP